MVASKTRIDLVPVGLGELKFSQSANEALVAYGLGSCVGIAICDSSAGLAALAHIILPSAATDAGRNENALKYADKAIPAMVNELVRLGGDKSRFVVRIAGGAQMLQTTGANDIFNIGARNVNQVCKELENLGLSIANQDVFGHMGRTMSVYPNDGRVTVHSAGSIKEL